MFPYIHIENKPYQQHTLIHSSDNPKRRSVMRNETDPKSTSSPICSINMSVKCIPRFCRKTGVYRSIPDFLFLIQNIDCGYSLEPPIYAQMISLIFTDRNKIFDKTSPVICIFI